MNRPWRSGVVLAATTVLAALAAGPAAVHAASQATAEQPVVLSVGHVDALEIEYAGGELDVRVKDDTGAQPVRRDPADVVLQALPESRSAVPDHPDFAFLGEPGDPVWILPQTQDPDLLWPGWNTELLGFEVFQGDQVSLTLTGVEGPGAVFVYIEDWLGLPIHQVSSEPDFPDSTTVSVGTHAHANWAFTSEGSYALTFQVDGTLPDGTTVSSGPVGYTFVVGELPDDPEVTLTVQGADGSYAPGQDVALVAVPDPDPGFDTYAWHRRCPGEDEFAAVPGETGGRYVFTATTELDGCAYRAELFDADGDRVARSEPVTLAVTDPGDPGASQVIVAAIPEEDGALVMSVDPDDRVVAMSPVELADTADRLESTGELRPVTVTDTRPGAPGWDASGRLGTFTSSGGDEFGPRYAGWTPTVATQADGQGVVAGPPVPPGFDAGSGLAEPAGLASAVPGSGIGTAVLGAHLRLELPTETPSGEYQALLTLTVI